MHQHQFFHIAPLGQLPHLPGGAVAARRLGGGTLVEEDVGLLGQGQELRTGGGVGGVDDGDAAELGHDLHRQRGADMAHGAGVDRVLLVVEDGEALLHGYLAEDNEFPLEAQDAQDALRYPQGAGIGVDGEGLLAPGHHEVVDEGGEAVDVVGVGVGDDGALQPLRVQPGFEELLVGASGAIEEKQGTGAVKNEKGVVAIGGGEGRRAPQDDDALHNHTPLKELRFVHRTGQ